MKQPRPRVTHIHEVKPENSRLKEGECFPVEFTGEKTLGA